MGFFDKLKGDGSSEKEEKPQKVQSKKKEIKKAAKKEEPVLELEEPAEPELQK
jgi:hypothetical protein